jgi:hypothetical protein
MPAMRWFLGLGGLFLLVFALCALAGPGRIDIVDGQTRYAVAKSLVEHGDTIVSDQGAWMNVYSGRNRERYAWFRLPHSLLGVPAIWLADVTAPAHIHSDPDRFEMRRQFFFSMIGAFSGALIAVCYALWFRKLGSSVGASLLWGLAGVLCTPNWYYSTSSFDDILGASAVVVAITAASLCRNRAPLRGAMLAGAAMAWAFNCKEPLGLFILPVLVLCYHGEMPKVRRMLPLAIVTGLVAAGCAFHFAYEAYTFPPGTTRPAEEFVRLYGPIWTTNPLPALAGFAASASAGIFFYCPTFYLTIRGWWTTYRAATLSPGEGLARVFCLTVAIAGILFTLFFCFVTFYNGNPAWGPRYLTPMFAVGWLFVPAALPQVRTFAFRSALVLGLIVQVLALSVDPMRLFLTTPIHFAYYHDNPWLPFNPRLSHLLQRPREILESIQPHDSQRDFSPAPLPTSAVDPNYPRTIFIAQAIGFTISAEGREPLHFLAFSQASVQLGMPQAYQLMGRSFGVYNTLRPWWISQRTLPALRRPVDLRTATDFFLLLLAAGLLFAGAAALPIAGSTKHLESRAKVAANLPPR